MGVKKATSYNYRKGQGRGKYLFHALLMNNVRVGCIALCRRMKKLRKGGQGKRLSLFILLGEPAFADVESERTKARVLALIGLA